MNTIFLQNAHCMWCVARLGTICTVQNVKNTRTNLKINNIFVSTKLVKKILANFDLSKVSAPDCIPLVILRKYEPQPSYILALIFNMKKSCFPDSCKVSSVVSKNPLKFQVVKEYKRNIL